MHALVRRFALPDRVAPTFGALLEALAAEPDPPTTLRAPDESIDGHLADGLVALELAAVRRARRIADVGAGAGFPGLGLAIALPAATIDLIEPASRKVAVIERLIAAAAIANARPVRARAEEWGARSGRSAYELVTARAVASLPVVAEYAAPLLALGGALVVWRGRRDEAEERRGAAAAVRLGLRVTEVRRVVPFSGARDRHLHVLEKVAPTPAEFPRRPGMAAKRPIA